VVVSSKVRSLLDHGLLVSKCPHTQGQMQAVGGSILHEGPGPVAAQLPVRTVTTTRLLCLYLPWLLPLLGAVVSSSKALRAKGWRLESLGVAVKLLTVIAWNLFELAGGLSSAKAQVLASNVTSSMSGMAKTRGVVGGCWEWTCNRIRSRYCRFQPAPWGRQQSMIQCISSTVNSWSGKCRTG
jgi:hypothetical protein